MSQFFYTAITHDETNEIQYAEHFEDEAEMQKRSRQLEAEARRLGPWKCYKGTEPVEAFLVRLNAKPRGKEIIEETDDKDAMLSKMTVFQMRVDDEAAKAGAKTVSVPTAPEIDDREIIDHSNPGAPVVVQAGRPLPEWALAQHEAEKAGQVLADATAHAAAAKAKAERINDLIFGTLPDRPDPREVLLEEWKKYNAELLRYNDRHTNYPPRPLRPDRQRAIQAHIELDQFNALLADAQSDFDAKAATARNLMDAEQTASKSRAKEARKNA